jgi:HEAT repeat protein
MRATGASKTEMNTGKASLNKYIADILRSEKLPTGSGLAKLSGIGDSSLQLMQEKWPQMDVIMRRRIVSKLLALSRKHLQLDFSRIFYFCLDDRDARVRAVALAGLSDEEDQRLSARFASMLLEDKSAEVRLQAAYALGRLAMLSEYGEVQQKNTDIIYQTLLKALDRKMETVRVKAAALQAVAPLSMPKVRGLIEAAYHSDKKELQLGAISAMGLNCSRMWLTALAEEIGNMDDERRLAAVRALGELGEQDASLYLIEVMEDENPLIQEEAIRALGQVGGPEARQMLENLLESPQERLRSRAAAALEELDICEDQLFSSF